MPIQSSGAISLANIQTEFLGANPISLSEYYRGSVNDYSKYIYAYDTSNNAINNLTVPSSGQVSLSNYYGTGRVFQYTISGSMQELNITSSWLTSVGWNGVMPVLITIQAGRYVWSNSTSTAGLTISYPITLENYGYIIGKGGNGGASWGNGGNGGPALATNVSGIIINNNSGAYIAGGGGGGASGYPNDRDGNTAESAGGGGGAGGGDGGRGWSNSLGGAGGAIGQVGGNGQVESYVTVASGGGAGGGGGGQYIFYEGGGGGGGRILPGSGGNGGHRDVYDSGGDGGSAGNIPATPSVSGQQDATSGGGGGGWGARGAYAGANSRTPGNGGAAISGTATTIVNNGTIYGSVV
jgi:hypothetical protein